jgi:hypothetical protein
MGERMMLGRRAKDGGWNYGNRSVLGHELHSYPETTAVALLGLMGAPGFDPSAPLARAAQDYHNTRSRLAAAWLSVCLRAYGCAVPDREPPLDGPAPALHVAALEALGAPDGNFSLFRSTPVQ